MGQNLVSLGVVKVPPAAAPASERNHFWQEGLQNVEASTKSTPLWNAFENSAEEQPIPNMLNSNDQAVEHHGFDAHNAFSAFEVLNNAGNVRAPHASETLSSSLSSHFSVALHDFSMDSLHSVATEHNSGNPFDLPYDTKIESGDMALWD